MKAQEPVREGAETTITGLISLRRLVYALIGTNLFCLVVLFGPDATIVAADSQLDIPIIRATISARVFLIFCPLVLMCLNLYTQALLSTISQSPRGVTEGGKASLDTTDRSMAEIPGSRFFIMILVYCLTPLSLLIMSWRALRRPESDFLVLLTIFFITGSVFMLIRQARSKERNYVYFLVGWLGVSLLLSLGYRLQNWVFPGRLRAVRCLDLVRADLKGRDLRGVDLSDAKMDHAILDLANLEGADLSRARLEDAQLKNAILRNACLNDALLRNANLEEADLRGAELKDAKLANANLKHAKLIEGNLRNADLANADLNEADLVEADLRKATFYESNLANAEMSAANLYDVWLHDTDLTKVTAFGAYFSLAKLTRAVLEGTRLDGAILIAADLSEATLNDAKLINADLTCSSLKKATLINADLTHAILINVDFEDADLSGANLQRADLRAARNLSCEQLRTARNWKSAYREKALQCNGPEDFLKAYDEEQDCEDVRNEIRKEIEK